MQRRFRIDYRYIFKPNSNIQLIPLKSSILTDPFIFLEAVISLKSKHVTTSRTEFHNQPLDEVERQQSLTEYNLICSDGYKDGRKEVVMPFY